MCIRDSRRYKTIRLWATRGILVQEADEVGDIESWRRGAAVTVCVGVACREAPEEADEVVDAQDRGRGAQVTVGVATETLRQPGHPRAMGRPAHGGAADRAAII